LITEADMSFYDKIYQMCKTPVINKLFPVISKDIWIIYSASYFRKTPVDI